MRQIRFISIHCSATREGQVVTAADVARWHNQRWPGHGCAYHYFIRLDGTVEKSRPEERIGNGVAGYNANSIHVCYAGGLASDGKTVKDTRTPAQKAAMASCIADLMRRYPAAVVKGHRDFSPDLDRDGKIEPHEYIKGCPSFDVADWLEESGLRAATISTLRPGQRRVSASSLNVRAGPAVSFGVIGKLKRGTVITPLESKDGWARILNGWVSEAHLEPEL